MDNIIYKGKEVKRMKNKTTFNYKEVVQVADKVMDDITSNQGLCYRSKVVKMVIEKMLKRYPSMTTKSFKTWIKNVVEASYKFNGALNN